MKQWGVLFLTFISVLEAEEPIFDFSSLMQSSFHEVSKEKAMSETRVWKKGKSSLRKTLMRRDKNAILHGHVHDTSLQWDWGLRNGIKYNDSQEEWVVAATYTHFHSKSYASLQKERDILPLWQEFGSPQAIELGQSEHSRWRLDVDISDLEMGKTFSIQDFLNVRPHVGVRGTWMYQKFEIDYEQFDKGYLREPILWNNCLGLGTRGGVDTLWNLGKSFRFFGDGALSFLSGYNNIHERALSIQSSNLSTGIAMMECSFGLQYEKTFSRSSRFLAMKVGYEFNYFLNQNRWADWFSPLDNNAAEQKISLQGLSLGFRLDF